MFVAIFLSVHWKIRSFFRAEHIARHQASEYCEQHFLFRLDDVFWQRVDRCADLSRHRNCITRIFHFRLENQQWKSFVFLLRKRTSGVADVFNKLYWIEPGFMASIRSQINIELLNEWSWKFVKNVVFFAFFNWNKVWSSRNVSIRINFYFVVRPIDDIFIRDRCLWFR